MHNRRVCFPWKGACRCTKCTWSHTASWSRSRSGCMAAVLSAGRCVTPGPVSCGSSATSEVGLIFYSSPSPKKFKVYRMKSNSNDMLGTMVTSDFFFLFLCPTLFWIGMCQYRCTIYSLHDARESLEARMMLHYLIHWSHFTKIRSRSLLFTSDEITFLYLFI